MILAAWTDLPRKLQTPEVKPYYDILAKKKGSLALKRVFDILVALIALVVLSPVFLVLALAIKSESQGPVFFRQTRITRYGKEFQIFKFRTMVNNADQLGSQVTVKNDPRVTKVGSFIRKYRLDEFPQLLNVLEGSMSFVGTRPEVPKYVNAYSPEMMATLLLPAGITSLASIAYKNEAELIGELLRHADEVDTVYIRDILPQKMKYNLQAMTEYGFLNDIKLMTKTLIAVFSHR